MPKREGIRRPRNTCPVTHVSCLTCKIILYDNTKNSNRLRQTKATRGKQHGENFIFVYEFVTALHSFSYIFALVISSGQKFHKTVIHKRCNLLVHFHNGINVILIFGYFAFHLSVILIFVYFAFHLTFKLSFSRGYFEIITRSGI